eukprot:913453-Prymnesium_polylepis.1
MRGAEAREVNNISREGLAERAAKKGVPKGRRGRLERGEVERKQVERGWAQHAGGNGRKGAGRAHLVDERAVPH